MKKLLAIVVCLALCVASVVTVIVALNIDGEDGGKSTGITSPDKNTDVRFEDLELTVGEKKYETTVPTYFIDLGDSSAIDEITHRNGVQETYNAEGFLTFKATNDDPYVNFRTAPTVDSTEMKYTVFVYRSSVEGANAEIYVARSDGQNMGESGTNVVFSVPVSTEWSSLIVDTTKITADGVSYTTYRIDPLANIASGTNGKSIDYKCVATFATEEDAKGFDYDVYKQYLEDKKAADKAEEESELMANSKWETVTPVDKETSADDTYTGTLKYEVSEDGKEVTISYVLNGETVSYTVPNNINYTSGGFGGTDDLDRTLPTSTTTGIYGENGEYYVGIFYFLWMGEHGDSGVWDMTKIIEKYPDAATNEERWGPLNAMHFFAEPLYGYYYSSDEWVARKHMELLSNANVDFLYFDVTNGFPYITNALKVMKVCHELNELGYDAPQVVFYTHSKAHDVVRQVYENIYSKNLYPDTWFCVDGKPVIIAPDDANINDFFIMRNDQWPNEESKSNSWPWMDFQYPQRIFADTTGKFGNAMSVSIAQHSGSVTFSTSALYGDLSNRGRTCVGMSDGRSKYEITEDSYKYGYNFQAQWDRVFRNKNNIKYVLVTGWNEWVAQRQPQNVAGQPIRFVDTINVEYSRDAEMTRGYYFDNYYMQLISNIQTLKGSAPVIVQDARNPINVTGSFDQWDNVLVTYQDAQGDTMNRNNSCFGHSKYTDESGNHDIVSAKVTQDTKNLYFYVSTAKNICFPNGKSSWMQLFIDVDKDASTGWSGYDYIVNYKIDVETYKSTVGKCWSTDGSYRYNACGTVDFKVEGNEMMIEVPLEMLGIENYKEVYIEFKWADADYTKDEEFARYRSMEDFYCMGDVAPLGRLNYIYQNYIPGVTLSEEETTTGGTVEQPSEGGDTETVTEEQTEPVAATNSCKSAAAGAMVAIVALLGAGVVIGKKRK